MSKALLICPRRSDTFLRSILHRRIKQLNEQLAPDNITFRAPLVLEHGGVTAAIFNPNETVKTHGASFALGQMISPSEDWWRPGAEVPEGTYALFRTGEGVSELVTDTLASRTIWYAQTEDIFLASTSQRALLPFLRSFEPHAPALSWMISAGHLGPDNVWDARLSALEGDARLRLDHATWQLTAERTPAVFEPADLPYEAHKARLKEALRETLGGLRLDYGRWALPLSGGYDSRAILTMLGEREGLKTLTWGVRSALEDKRSDAYVAKALSRHFGVAHQYFETDLSEEPIEAIFNRFLVAGEGRVDHISGYMDGFGIWKQLFEGGVSGILRGDESFGWTQVDTAWDVRRTTGLHLLSDFRNLEPHTLPAQPLAETLEQRPGESLATWRDRLYHTCRVPVILAALSDLKTPYVELFNPLIVGKLVEQVRTLPDELRTSKQLFRDIIVEEGPAIDFAKREATRDRGDILKEPHIVHYLQDELGSAQARRVLSADFLRFATQNVKVSDPSESSKRFLGKEQLKGALNRYLPKSLRKAGKSALQKPAMDANRAAFRAFLVVKMYDMLEADATLFKST